MHVQYTFELPVHELLVPPDRDDHGMLLVPTFPERFVLGLYTGQLSMAWTKQ